MVLKELLDALRYGEFSRLSLGGEDQGVISLKNYPVVANFINMGLTALYARFNLKEEEAVLPLELDKYDYTLAYPNMLKLARVYTEKDYEFTLNNFSDPLSIINSNLRSIRVPKPIVDKDTNLADYLLTDSLRIVYRANHPLLDTDATAIYDEEDTTLELPYPFIEPLVYFVASRATTPMDVAGQFHTGNNYASKYEQACQRLEFNNAGVDRGSQGNSKFVMRGWV